MVVTITVEEGYSLKSGFAFADLTTDSVASEYSIEEDDVDVVAEAGTVTITLDITLS